jgi:uncharacterized protein YbjT (DUF2867 family)
MRIAVAGGTGAVGTLVVDAARARLLRRASGPALGLAPEPAGPEDQQMVSMVRRVVAARRLRELVVPVSLPGSTGRRMRDGGLLPTGPGPRGTETFDEWLSPPVAVR